MPINCLVSSGTRQHGYGPCEGKLKQEAACTKRAMNARHFQRKNTKAEVHCAGNFNRINLVIIVQAMTLCSQLELASSSSGQRLLDFLVNLSFIALHPVGCYSEPSHHDPYLHNPLQQYQILFSTSVDTILQLTCTCDFINNT
jgi:hypothetical protein